MYFANKETNESLSLLSSLEIKVHVLAKPADTAHLHVHVYLS